MLLVRCFLLQLVHQNEDLYPRYLWTNAHFYSHCFVTIPGLLEATLEQQEKPILQKQQARLPSWFCSPSPNRALATHACCTGRGLSRCCTWAMVAPHALNMPPEERVGNRHWKQCSACFSHVARCRLLWSNHCWCCHPCKVHLWGRRWCCFITERGKTERKKWAQGSCLE